MKLSLVLFFTYSCHCFRFFPINFHRLKWINNGGSRSLSWRKRPFFHPKPKFATFKPKQFIAAAVLNETETVEFGIRFVQRELGLELSELNLTSSYTDTANVTHIYFTHLINGIEVANHHAALHLKRNNVLAFSSSFNNDKSNLYKRHQYQEHYKISKETAVSIAVNEFKVKMRPDKPVELKYIELPNGSLSQAYVIQLKDAKNCLQVFVDTRHGMLLGMIFISRSNRTCYRFHICCSISSGTFEFGRSSQGYYYPY